MKWKRALILFLFIAVFCPYSNAHYTPKQYIEKFAPVAIVMMHRYEIPASVILGIAFLESGYGNSKNSELLNNHFGLVGKNNLRKIGKYRSAYKQFDNDTLSYDYFCRTIVSKKYYKRIKGKMNYKIWLSKIHRHNYARAKHTWLKHITQIIKKYHLYRFDVI